MGFNIGIHRTDFHMDKWLLVMNGLGTEWQSFTLGQSHSKHYFLLVILNT